MTPTEAATALSLLLAAHFVCDYPLQGDFLAKAKADGPLRWWHLFGHSLIHGAAVGIITGHAFLGVLETVVHFGIDELKVQRRTTFAQDQAAHAVCKAFWVALMFWSIQ